MPGKRSTRAAAGAGSIRQRPDGTWEGRYVVGHDPENGETVFDTVPMSPKTVHSIHGTLTKALSTAVSIGYLRTNSADRATLPRIEKNEKKELTPLTDAQVKDFLRVSAEDSLEIIRKDDSAARMEAHIKSL